MLIKKISILFSLAIFCSLLGYYIITSTSPIDIQKTQEIINKNDIDEKSPEKLAAEIQEIIDNGGAFSLISSNAYLAAGLILISVFGISAAIHMIIDKLFFKKFFEQPNNYVAFRRAFLITLVLGIVSALQLMRFDLQTLIVAPLVALLIEILFMLFQKKDKGEELNLDK